MASLFGRPSDSVPIACQFSFPILLVLEHVQQSHFVFQSRFLWMPKAAAVGEVEKHISWIDQKSTLGTSTRIGAGVACAFDFLGGRRNRITTFKRSSEVSVASDSVYNLRAGICF
jgi:hypothetical protein